MSKEKLKIVEMEKVGLVEKGAPVIPTYMYDLHRPKSKVEGGEYTEENIQLVNPILHQIKHGNYRERTEHLETLKTAMEDRRQLMKLYYKINNQILAYRRGTDKPNEEMVAYLIETGKGVGNKLKKTSSELNKAVKRLSEVDYFTKVALNVPGVGPITVAACAYYIDLTIAKYPGNLWSYAGLHKASHARYEKGVKGGGNKTLRTILYTMADSQIKTRGPYREVYDIAKEKKSKSTELVKTRITRGVYKEVPWCETKKCHRDGHAKRMIMKHYLADYWKVGRDIMGLPTQPLYVECILEGPHRVVRPEERGWVY